MDRRVELDGAGNFRDLGGLAVSGGGATRRGLVFRADRLSSLSDADLARLEAVGIRHVFDLRSDGETADFPDRLPDGTAYVRMPMTSDDRMDSRTVYERILTDEVTSYGEADMAAGYLRMLDKFGPSFARIVRQAGRGEPLVVHCTAGKDRTGVAAMVLLDLAGVSAEHIVADYELSSQRRRSRQYDYTEAGSLRAMLAERGLDPDAFAPLWEARAAVMEEVLDQFQQRWGGAAGYLAASGMDDEEIASARHWLRD